MALELYPHQVQASQAVSQMLMNKGCAAVILPTGTGKSYIAFHLIEQHPDSLFLWLGPSEYIFQTQTAALRSTAPELSLHNVTFLTYASLIYKSADELAQIPCDYIILDEFHRCGSEHWGAAVRQILESHQQAKLLGLSATHIRYLDHHRNMAEELLDNCIASEMTLGEAIVRGILPAPKYVTTVYQYQQSLARYEERISTLTNQYSRSKSERYLQALRRSLAEADGLDVVFAKHMKERHGRYIVFCASVEHMQEIQAHVRDWLHAIDEQPHCYQVYAESAEAASAYAAFQQDNSPHLKLLLCVNMLNEGVHVEGISGVILFRPTLSPIVYKQQVGRALTVGHHMVPLILDVVNNVDGLRSVESLEEEMEQAVAQLRAEGMSQFIVQEKLHVIDQVKDCRALFEQLEGSLRMDWNEYYQAAVRYHEEHGNLLIPQHYVTEDGKCLGYWLVNQRRIHNNRHYGVLTGEQELLLEKLGIIWDDMRQVKWENYFAKAEAYYREHGNLLVTQDYVTEDGYNLGQWLSSQRKCYCKLKSSEKSSQEMERFQRLESIGMTWNTYDARWEKYFKAAEKYYHEYGNLLVPSDYQTEDGLKLGIWLIKQRNKRNRRVKERLTDEQIQRLDSIHMQWDGVLHQQWMTYYLAAKDYYCNNGNLQIAKQYKTTSGLNLGTWITTQRANRKKSTADRQFISSQRIELLNEIGMRW